MQKAPLLNELLANLLNEASDLQAALVVDLEGLIIAQQSVEGFNEEIIGAIMSVLEQTLSKIKRFAETSYGSGTFDTNEFRLFYLELGGTGLFVLVADPYSKIESLTSYSYLVAEKVSLILNNIQTSTELPKLNSTGNFIPKDIDVSDEGKSKVNKLLLIGPENCGKTCLLNMYINGEFIDNYKPTIGVSLAEKELQITNRLKICLIFFDLGGLKSFSKVRRFFYNDANTVIILFDYTREETLNTINEWIEEARQFVGNKAVTYLLVGNKIDLAKNRDQLKQKAESIASHNNCFFFETSAHTGEGLDEVFTFLATNCI